MLCQCDFAASIGVGLAGDLTSGSSVAVQLELELESSSFNWMSEQAADRCPRSADMPQWTNAGY